MKSGIALALLLPFLAFGYASPGEPRGHVSDFAGILSPALVSEIETDLKELEQATGNEVAVVTIVRVGDDETIESYAVKLFEEWGIGKEKEDNGLLLLIAKDDREVRIEVGYGLEGDITDVMSGRVIREILVPAFQAGDYDGGVRGAVDEISAKLKTGASPYEKRAVDLSWLGGNLPIILAFVFTFFASVLGRSKSWWAGGVVGAIAALVIGLIWSLSAGLFSALLLVPFGLLFDYLVSKHYDKHKDGPRPPWFLGGGGGFGGGGFGGFGGGGSGGGGASGRW
jgi:uncharacterized protein